MRPDRTPLVKWWAAALTAAVVIQGCAGDLPLTEELTPGLPASNDPGAGDWRYIVLTGPSQIPVATPAAVTSDAYLAEVAAVRTAQAGITDAQRENVQFWGGNGTLRWNQIVRELVAKYNLPPAPRGETYPVPDADNPFADPAFPFANPPYAARAYSYLALAQYEALKVAWSYKYQYNRPSPARVDSSVQALVPIGDLPAYPSEDAVLSGVTTEVLRALFPAAIEEVTRRAGQQREAALLSGKATASDIAAGLALGRAVAAVFTARAGADGMRTAGGSPAFWASLAAAATARGETPWVSLEVPARPPMLPAFGQVRTWLLTPAELVSERPPAPPSTSSSEMQQELAEVVSTGANLTREQLAIAFKWNDGAGTYTPPGHWNDIAAEYIRDSRFSEVRAARTFAFMNVAMHDAVVGCWEAKFFYFNPRPAQLNREFKSAIGVPNFPAYTSGHSSFSSAAAAVLGYVFPSAGSEFQAMADEAAISRLYGGIHYRSDIERGKEHGRRIAEYTLRFARQDGAN